MRIIIKLKSFDQISPFKSVYKLKNNNICQTSTLARITCMEATTISSHIRASSPRTWIHQGLERIKPIPRTIQAAIITSSSSLALAKTSALIWSVNSSKSRSTSRRWRRLLMCHRELIAPKLSSHSATRQRIRRRRSRRNKNTSRRRKISIRAR